MYCSQCGSDNLVNIGNDRMICRNCHTVKPARVNGPLTEQEPQPKEGECFYKEIIRWGTCPATKKKKGPSSAAIVAKVFMIISCVMQGLCILPLAWCLPMTITYSRKLKRGERVGPGLKICTMFFVNTIAGILMFCDNDD